MIKGHRRLFSLLFVALLVLPAGLGIAGLAGSASKTHKPPGWQWELLRDAEYYQAWGRYLEDRLARIDALTRAKRWLDYRLFKTTHAPDLYVGREGWLFARRDIDVLRRDACHQHHRIQQLLDELHAAAHLIEASGRRFVFSVIPAKATIYPEFAGYLPPAPGCRQSAYELLLTAEAKQRLPGFVRLDTVLLAAKARGTPVYSDTGAKWEEQGAAIAAGALAPAVFGDADHPASDRDDLKALLLSGVRSLEADPDRSRSGIAAAVIYGGPAVHDLLPFPARPFARTDVIAARTIPSPNHGEHLAGYDTIAVLVDEARLADVRVDLDRLCHMLAVDGLADSVTAVPPASAYPESHLSLDVDGDRLAVKSLGGSAFLILPSLPGSDPATLRLLALDIEGPAAGTLAWGWAGSPGSLQHRTIPSGGARIYLPLPLRAAVRLRINPGETTGIYHLSNIRILEYAHAVAASPPEGAGGQALAASHPEESAETWPELPLADTPAPAIVDVAPVAIRINDYEDLRVFQRSGHSADIVVSGTYGGPSQSVEARIVRHGDGEAVTGWRIIDRRPGDGIFMGTIGGVPQGGWYRLEVRFAAQTEIMDQGRTRFGVGMLIALIGQSNMKEMFHTGDALSPHSLLVVHREGQWQAMARIGNGAIALGNRLIGRLGIPVGLLDYAVNGSGLLREADFGTGYWADRSDKGIYRAFIDGVSAAGGAVEHVVWMQGEADAARGTISAAQYRKTLDAFITRQVRRDIANGGDRPHLPFLIVGMPKRPGGRDAPHQEIHDALTAAARGVPECHLAATTLDLKTMGRQHLAPEAYTALGLRVAQTVLCLLDKEDYYRGPSVAQARRLSADTFQVDLIHRGGTDFSPDGVITGWQALGRQGAIPVAEVWRHGSDALRIRLGHAWEEPVTLYYLYGAHPDTARAVRDNSPMELPMEPARVEVQ